MAVSLPDARELSDEVLEALRLRALHGCELGFTEADVADLLGVCRETVCRWWSAYARGGVDPLPQHRTGRPLGSGRVLTQEQASHTGGNGFWGYNIYREDPGTSSYGLVGQIPESPSATPGTSYSFTDTGATAGVAPKCSA